MSSDHPEPGVSDPKGQHESGATAASPQQSSNPQPVATETADASSKPVPVAESATTVVPAEPVQPGDNPATAIQHPATGGESVAPVTATETTASTDHDHTTPENADTVGQPQTTDAPSMDTDESKPGAELSSEPSEDISGKEVEDTGPSLALTLLLTTGSRHPFKIDAKYLRKQSVNVENHDPFAMSVYTLKELIWREWRSDWEARPSSPSSIRLISFGKLLDDKAPLSDSKFSADHPNVVHMTVKPQEMIDEEDAKGTKTQYNREREAGERSPGCRCVIL
ncbi:hypothetical protein N7462_004389 [Penicillium macrosclerotiorum]|uniref:uncharacterized protein n=1 Tax=Penicillium macrosclerotiorum TaxID=303699 RepID=UPI0025470F96|nr:uncharacterized protein N7462_004389 [Penicillium macrosclerotiorum]KAJ5689997.1 hypothetical protein N7462_004389 [Penicillium macrosclerotiorum]